MGVRYLGLGLYQNALSSNGPQADEEAAKQLHGNWRWRRRWTTGGSAVNNGYGAATDVAGSALPPTLNIRLGRLDTLRKAFWDVADRQDVEWINQRLGPKAYSDAKSWVLLPINGHMVQKLARWIKTVAAYAWLKFTSWTQDYFQLPTTGTASQGYLDCMPRDIATWDTINAFSRAIDLNSAVLQRNKVKSQRHSAERIDARLWLRCNTGKQSWSCSRFCLGLIQNNRKPFVFMGCNLSVQHLSWWSPCLRRSLVWSLITVLKTFRGAPTLLLLRLPKKATAIVKASEA